MKSERGERLWGSSIVYEEDIPVIVRRRGVTMTVRHNSLLTLLCLSPWLKGFIEAGLRLYKESERERLQDIRSGWRPQDEDWH